VMGVRAPLWISYGILPVTALGIRLVAVGHLAVAGRLAIAREQAANASSRVHGIRGRTFDN
jgi:hypothetical protein